jgi:hypothetical protein
VAYLLTIAAVGLIVLTIFAVAAFCERRPPVEVVPIATETPTIQPTATNHGWTPTPTATPDPPEPILSTPTPTASIEVPPTNEPDPTRTPNPTVNQKG